MFFDAHCHLMDDSVYLDAIEKGVRAFIVNSVKQDDWDKIFDLHCRMTGIYVCAGIHPWFVSDLAPDWDYHLEKFLQNHKHAMIGEIGLDKTKPFFPKQKEVFNRCLELAAKYNRKVHIHCVRAWEDMLETLFQYHEVQPLFHRFSGDEVIVQKLRLLNAYYSVIDPKVMDVIPDNRLLVESDGPDGLKPSDIPDLVSRLHLSEEYLEQNLRDFLSYDY